MEAAFFAGIILILLFSVVLHEVMHGLTALYFGDHTAENAGRLTLNPLPHIDPLGSVLLPALLYFTSGFIFGWAKPVPVNPLNFRDLRKGELVVSSAGILTNLSLALLAALLFHLTGSLLSPLLLGLLKFAIDINLILAVFNLLPIPPLDGSKILLTLLPPHLASQYAALERYGFFILIFLWMIPFGRGTLLGSVLGVVLKFAHAALGV